MKTYWDTSALINALVSPTVMARLQKEGGISRPHALSEFFSHMTGRGIEFDKSRMKLTANAATTWLAHAAKFLDWVELGAPEIMAALSEAQSRNVSGGRVHDYLHSTAAVKAKADKILTRDGSFAALGAGIPCEKP